jgi:hypothetical protein
VGLPVALTRFGLQLGSPLRFPNCFLAGGFYDVAFRKMRRVRKPQCTIQAAFAMKRLASSARCSRPCRGWGVSRGRQGSSMGHRLALGASSPSVKCALPKIATLGARVRHDAGTFAHKEGHHRVRRGRLGLELASLPAKVSTGVRLDPLISAVSELFAALRAAVGRMLMAPTPSIQYGKGGLLGHDFRRPLRRMRPIVSLHAWLGRFVAPATPRGTR